MLPRLRVLFLCTGNSCRSQMAEGWAGKLKNDRIEALSAGVSPHALDPRAVTVMAEAGVDISSQTPTAVDAVLGEAFDFVVMVRSDAHENCPLFPGEASLVHRGFDDPPRLSATATSEDEALQHYRRVRDETCSFVEGLQESLPARAPRPSAETARPEHQT